MHFSFCTKPEVMILVLEYLEIIRKLSPYAPSCSEVMGIFIIWGLAGTRSQEGFVSRGKI